MLEKQALKARHDVPREQYPYTDNFARIARLFGHIGKIYPRAGLCRLVGDESAMTEF